MEQATAIKINLLLVEDNESDIILMEEGLKNVTVPVNLMVAKDGEMALAMLNHSTEYSQTPIPDLIIMDLNLPKISGAEVLKNIKQDENLKTIPVIILSGSKSTEEIRTIYALHANCCICKPSSLNDLKEMWATIEKFWFHTAALPSKVIK